MPKKFFSLFLASLLLLQPHLIFAAEVLSLDSLIAEAKKNNPGIRAAYKRYEAASARIPQARSLDNPTLGIEFDKIPRGTLKLNKVMSDDRMFSISQALPFFGKLSLKGKIALIESQILASEYKNKELEVINAVKNAYFELFMSNKEIELSQESLKFLEDIARVAEARYATLQIPQEEVLKIYSEIARLSNIIANLRQEASAKKTRLNTILGRQPEAGLGAPTLDEEVSFSEDSDTLYRLTIENQPELLTFSYAIERNKFAKSLAKRSFFPDFMASIVQRGISSGTIGPWDLMLAFTIPLWFWSKQRYEVKEAIANLEEAKLAYEAMKNKALAETKELATKIEIAKNKIKLYKTELMPIIEGSIQVSLAGFRSRESDFMLLLDSFRMLTETKMNYYQALVEYNMNLSDLERAVGMDLREVKNEE